MEREQRQLWRPRLGAARFLLPAEALLVTLLSPAAAQDIRGLEVCTAETQMLRRTGCLQANVEFLQQALIKLARETQDRSPPPIAILPLPAPRSPRSNQQWRS